MFCFVGLLSTIPKLIFQYFAEQEQKQQNATSNAEILEISVKTPKKKTVNNEARERSEPILPWFSKEKKASSYRVVRA